MKLRDLIPRRSSGDFVSSYIDPREGELGHLLFLSIRPGIQVLWTVLFISVLIYTFAGGQGVDAWAVVLLSASFLAVVVGNHYFPFQKYRPYLFFALLCASLVLISCLVYLTGNRASLLGFLFFTVPIYAAAYYSYPGTLLMAALTSFARFMPFLRDGAGSLEHLSLALTAVAYFIVGFLACYVVEGEKMYARESYEYRRLLEVSMDKEKEVSVIYNLSRRFSYTLDLDSVLKTTAALARKMLASEGALVFLLEDHRPVLKAALGTIPFADITSIALPGDESWMGQLIEGNNVIAERTPLDWLPLPGAHPVEYSVAAVPLFVGGDIRGYLMCFTPASRGFKESHLDILSTLASQAAVAVEKARLYTRTLDDKMKLETILFALRDGLVVTDSDGFITQLNPVAERMLSLGRDPVSCNLRVALEEVVTRHDLGRHGLSDAVDSVLDGRTVFGEMTLAQESEVSVQAHMIPLVDEIKNISGMVLFLHDITEFKRLDEMKSNFVSNISHELRTPLTSIIGFVSLMLAGRAGTLKPPQREYLEVVRDQANNLKKLIEDLLDLSRIQALRGRIEGEEVSLDGLVRDCLKGFDSMARQKELSLEIHALEDVPPVRADPDRVEQVLANIVGNAVKYTEPGGRIEVGLLVGDGFVQVRVSDNGIGISRSSLPHIFDRFFQAHSGESEERSGFGLGLAICKEIVELHGGRIWAESDPGRGSTFHFTLPVWGEESR